MSKVSFTVSARTAKLIGQENFATAEGAIVELVKNSYDADATNCIIAFQGHNESGCKEPAIFIIDNGVGMTGEVILNQWMKIGTDDKLENYESEGGRVKTGAKGIGRFALDRLGLASEMFTVSKDPAEGSFWNVKWSDFDKLGISIDQVEADLNKSDELEIKELLLDQFVGFKNLTETINAISFESGTILKISPLKDTWDEDTLKSLFDNLEVLIPPKEQPDFSVHLFSSAHSDSFGLVNSAYYDDFDYKVEATYLGNGSRMLNLEITRNELDVTALETTFKDVFDYDRMKLTPFKLQNFKSRSFKITKNINELSGFSKVDDELIEKIGAFDFTFYFLKNTSDSSNKRKYPYKIFSAANRKSWLKKFGGVKIFRDDFRVRPYGEGGQDWLRLGERQAQSPGGPGQKIGGYRIGPNQIAGTVNISRIANSNFQDKSGREGIQENDAFELFKNLLKEIVSFFERDRNIVMFSLSELSDQKYKDEEAKRKAKEEAERILREQEEAENNQSNQENDNQNPSPHKNTEAEKILAQANVIYEKEIEEKDEEIKLLRGLASVGLIISSFAHELKGLQTRLVPRTDFLITELKKYISKDELKSKNREDDPFYMIQLIRDEDIKLKHWLDYSLSTLKRDKRTRTNINLGVYFEQFEKTWKRALDQRKIKIIRKGTNDLKNVIRAFEVDLDAIFNNLLSNSLSAFKEKKGNYEREVTINWKEKEGFIIIHFSDNGIGLAEEYMSEPGRIFEFNESSRRDRKGTKIGTGMGLYIVKLVIDDYNQADIKILPNTGGFSLEVKLPTQNKADQNV